VKTPSPDPEPAPEGQENQDDLWQLRDPTPHPHLSDSDEDGLPEVHFAGITAGTDPHSFKQAMACPDAHRWQEAAVDEVNTLVANGTWEIVNLPPGKKAIGLVGCSR
jgi:hypothetical protein